MYFVTLLLLYTQIYPYTQLAKCEVLIFLKVNTKNEKWKSNIHYSDQEIEYFLNPRSPFVFIVVLGGVHCEIY
jgi:hypothetical protein